VRNLNVDGIVEFQAVNSSALNGEWQQDMPGDVSGDWCSTFSIRLFKFYYFGSGIHNLAQAFQILIFIFFVLSQHEVCRRSIDCIDIGTSAFCR